MARHDTDGPPGVKTPGEAAPHEPGSGAGGSAPFTDRLFWHRREVITLALVTALTGGALAVNASKRLALPDTLPVWDDRVNAARQRIDPNTAGIASLRRLPQIGMVRAEAIVEYRRNSTTRPFVVAEDLTKVTGIGPGIIHRIQQDMDLPAKRE